MSFFFFVFFEDACGRAWRPAKRTPTRLRPGKNLTPQLLCQRRLTLFVILGFTYCFTYYFTYCFTYCFTYYFTYCFTYCLTYCFTYCFTWINSFLNYDLPWINSFWVAKVCAHHRWGHCHSRGDPPRKTSPSMGGNYQVVTLVTVVFQNRKGLLCGHLWITYLVTWVFLWIFQTFPNPSQSCLRSVRRTRWGSQWTAENWQVHIQSAQFLRGPKWQFYHVYVYIYIIILYTIL